MKFTRHYLVVKNLSFMAACGLRNVEFATESKRSVDCARCRRTLQFKMRQAECPRILMSRTRSAASNSGL